MRLVRLCVGRKDEASWHRVRLRRPRWSFRQSLFLCLSTHVCAVHARLTTIRYEALLRKLRLVANDSSELSWSRLTTGSRRRPGALTGTVDGPGLLMEEEAPGADGDDADSVNTDTDVPPL